MDTEELRRLAEAATPGPWEWTANPQTILRLLDERDRLRAALERLATSVDMFGSLGRSDVAFDEARALLADSSPQPVAEEK